MSSVVIKQPPWTHSSFFFTTTKNSRHINIDSNFLQLHNRTMGPGLSPRILLSMTSKDNGKAAFKFAGRNRNHVTGHCVTHVLDSETGQLDIETTLEMAKYSNVKRLKKMRRV
ncbi:hypothetical protein Ae201684_010532 [Aphanomyces euteiches]|uniref:Uncharacterized protein n=1 Tax=Aphanomyces euteiches TaxID=100861 RepID=A0A6G0WXE8_9STRA|nr:hypothetical protein Ae201684_010532 [Aphanomyces euteiches]